MTWRGQATFRSGVLSGGWGGLDLGVFGSPAETHLRIGVSEPGSADG